MYNIDQYAEMNAQTNLACAVSPMPDWSIKNKKNPNPAAIAYRVIRHLDGLPDHLFRSFRRQLISIKARLAHFVYQRL